MEKIKLVVWDLDETFWKGTLSEGDIKIIQQNVEIVKELTSRGIINSISSKNDYEKAKTVLVKADIWDYFIFPSIDWTPKGLNIKNIIEQCQLRAPNILFIDDNIGNRKEAEHYNPGINTADENIIPKLLELDELKGKDDHKLSRLKQYKILEQKAEAKASYTDNLAFLRDSNIRIMFRDCNEYKERILELINRTNQLNFTKERIGNDELEQLLNDENYNNGCVEVRDKFGDYGICGFYSVDKRNNTLSHFLFSCRILNLGIEAWIYNKLGKPGINVMPPVAGDLLPNYTIDWIKEVKEFKDDKSDVVKDRIRVLMIGGCDLEQMCHYINKDKFVVLKEFNYPSPNGYPVHREHSVYLREIEMLTQEDINSIASLPFGDEKMFDTLLFGDDYDVLVYSVLMNYTHEVYKNKEKGFKIAYGGYKNQMQLCDYLKMDDDQKNNFVNRFEFEGLQTPEEFIEDLKWLKDRINKPIVFLNGAETENVNEREPLAAERHREMNIVLDAFVKENPGKCSVVDVRKYIHGKSDHKDTIRHYQRPIYVSMAEDLMSILANREIKVSWFVVMKTRVKEGVHRLSRIAYHFLKK